MCLKFAVLAEKLPAAPPAAPNIVSRATNYCRRPINRAFLPHTPNLKHNTHTLKISTVNKNSKSEIRDKRKQILTAGRGCGTIDTSINYESNSVATANKLTRPQQFAIFAACNRREGIKPKHPSLDDRLFMEGLAHCFKVSTATIAAIAGAHPHSYKFAWQEFEKLGLEAMYEKYKGELS